MTTDYQAFINRKRLAAKQDGLKIEPDELNPLAMPWQRDVAAWLLKMGRAGAFLDTGLGKTFLELMFAERIIERTQIKKALLLCPLVVGHQFVDEARKFNIGVDVRVVKDSSEVDSGINVTNYERLHKFDLKEFDIVVLDEGSILKSYMGKTKQRLCDGLSHARYKLTATATPAPNDLMEIGNQCEFLGVMDSRDMLSRWFINDTMKAGGYRLMGHAQRDFWRWVASWAVAMSTPRDLGYDEPGYDLPPLNVHEVVVEDDLPALPGQLFANHKPSATTVHQEKRATSELRAVEVAKLVNQSKEQWAIWCNTDYEADELKRVVKDAVEVRGSHKPEHKEQALIAFSRGEVRNIITKPEIAGFGLNWQHCSHTAFIGLSYSFEAFYQAVRRLWRFGQTRPVNAYLISTPGEAAISDRVWDKSDAHEATRSKIIDYMRDAMLGNLYGGLERAKYQPTMEQELPTWLTSKA